MVVRRQGLAAICVAPIRSIRLHPAHFPSLAPAAATVSELQEEIKGLEGELERLRKAQQVRSNGVICGNGRLAWELCHTLLHRPKQLQVGASASEDELRELKERVRALTQDKSDLTAVVTAPAHCGTHQRKRAEPANNAPSITRLALQLYRKWRRCGMRFRTSLRG